MEELYPVRVMPAPPPYLNRFSPSNRWDSIRFRTAHGLQSSELNEVESLVLDRTSKLGKGVYKDGHIVENARIISLQPPTSDGNFRIEAGRVSIRGYVIDVPAGFITIPLTEYVVIGLRYRQTEVTEVQDNTLLNQATGTRGYLEPGASRIKEEYAWGWNAVSTSDANVGWDAFYSVYEVSNGVVITRDIPPESDPVVSIVARYDRESSGNYVVKGLLTRYVDITAGQYRFDVSAGLANILGYKVERSSNAIITQSILSTTVDVVGEPHTYVGHLAVPAGYQGPLAATRSENIVLNKGPIAAVTRILGTKIKQIFTMVKGAANGEDQLPDTTVSRIFIVRTGSGGSTVNYLENTDWVRSGNYVNWLPAGNEPAVGASYEVIYSYETVITPLSRTPTTIEVGGLEMDSQIYVDYSYSLPRKDLIVLNKAGNLEIFAGESQARNPAAPIASTDQIALATIDHDWVNDPLVKIVAVRAIPFNEIAAMQKAIANLFELNAIANLKIDGRLKIEGQALGLFVDSFKDNTNRDAANPQTAAVYRNTLQLPVGGDAFPPSNTTNLMKYWTLDFTLEEIVVQDEKTGCMFVNPYVYVAPPPNNPTGAPVPAIPPPTVTVIPPVDPWITTPGGPNGDPTGPIISSPTDDEYEVIQLRYTPPQPGRDNPYNQAWYTREHRTVGIHVRGAKPHEHFVEILDWH